MTRQTMQGSCVPQSSAPCQEIPKEDLKIIAHAQRRLLRLRRRCGLPVDARSVENLHTLDRMLEDKAA
jgi:hypothetical protein